MGRLSPLLIMIISMLCVPSFAADKMGESLQSNFSLRWENDTVSKTDENYTNGLSIAISKSGAGLLGGLWDLGGSSAGDKSSVYELTQMQYTPHNLNNSSVDLDDRPYSGITYLACMTHLQRANSLQSLKLILGVIGPYSGAEESQKFIHRLIGQNEPQGWELQLKNEPLINLLYEFRYRYRLAGMSRLFGVDIIPMGGAFLGNSLIQAQTEVLLRFGQKLPDDFGATSLRGIGYLPYPRPGNSDNSWGVNGHIRGGVNLVARNITLDGNTFERSHRVDKRALVPVVEAGTTILTHLFMVTVSYQIWGREFDSQRQREGYGSILFTIPY